MSPSTSRSDFIVVLRTAAERTAPTSKVLLSSEVPDSVLYEVNEAPFEAALRRCLAIALESGAAWMVTVDADVLARRGAVRDLLQAAERLPSNYVQVEGVVLDKLYGGFRKAGHRAYRIAHLKEASLLIPEDGSEIRPEFSMLKALAARGFPSAECDVAFGVHDYEQSYKDLYRKAFVHGQKHPHWLSDAVLEWRGASSADADFGVALRGFCDGLQSMDRAPIDVRFFRDRAEAAMRELGLSEKDPLEALPEKIEGVRAEVQGQLDRAARDAPGSISKRLRRNLGRLGLVRLVPYLTGGALVAMGGRLRKLAESS